MHAGTDGLGVRHGVMLRGLWVGWWVAGMDLEGGDGRGVVGACWLIE